METSTPRPSVSAITSATVAGPTSTTSVAPNSSALSSRNLLESTAMTFEAPHSPVVRMADRPTAPAPTTATVSPGRTCPASTPTSYPVGSESARKMACSLVTCPGTAYSEVSAYGTRTDSAWVPSMRWPKIQPIPPTVWQCEGMPRWQYSQRPHFVMAGTRTRSPTANPLTASPTSVTVPTASWPRMRPSVTAATSPWRMCRSVPQIVVVSTRTTTSVGSWIAASGTSSQAFLPGPWYTSAFKAASNCACGASPIGGPHTQASD